ncbi:hypothetical protein Tco_0186725, partial [Tanacetum coccineum]
MVFTCIMKLESGTTFGSSVNAIPKSSCRTRLFANLSEEDASIDSLDVDINVSGKLQLLDKFLSEIKQCGFRVVVLFQ